MVNKAPKKRIFLDYASTTPLDGKVFSEMKPYFSEKFENPSSLYEEGLTAKRAIENARKEIAGLLRARPAEIIFTGSGTESANLAILGLFESVRENFESRNKKPHIVTTMIEHPAVLESCLEVEKRGGIVTYLQPNDDGIVSSRQVREALTPETILVTIMFVNNEIGSVELLADIGREIRKYKKAGALFPFFHTDASQAANYLELFHEKYGMDMMTLDGSKMYGPKGVGVLYRKEIVPLSPIIFGGGQEKGLRSGTENVPAIVGMAAALRLTQKIREKEHERLFKLREYLVTEIFKRFPTVTKNGQREGVPNIVSLCIPNHDGEFMVIQFDAAGIAVASVSACKNLSEKTTSYVIEALGEKGKKCAGSSLRVSMGRGTTKKDLDVFLRTLEIILKN